MNNSVLIIDDEDKLRSLLVKIIAIEGYEVLEAADLKSGFKKIENNLPLVILCDVKLPDGNGVDFVAKVKSKYPEIEIILLTAYGNIPDGVQAIKNGAFDYIVKGDDNNKIIPLLSKAIEKAALQFKIKALQKKLTGGVTFSNIIGKSDEIKQAITLAQKVAPTDTTVLLTGETGTGKEVFAQAIHNESNRNQNAFVALNCSAFSREILESELFGHKAGAFTGAIRDKKGLVEEAEKGTLFLDELGEMPIDLQAKLLRFLESGEYHKVGDTKLYHSDVRIIAATNRNLKEESNNGKFRLDLFYRLATFQIQIPSLNQRKKDIPLLADFFLGVYNLKLKKNITQMSDEFVEKLKSHHWQGNVRELRNVMERACLLANNEALEVSDLPFEFQFETQKIENNSFLLQEIEKMHIQKVLLYVQNNKTKAAELLGIGQTTLYAKIKEFGLN